jgi:phosphoenolpyruvate synthase/pyruvate phosphate dikinase
MFGNKNVLVYHVGDDNRGFFAKEYYEKTTQAVIKKQKKNRDYVDRIYKKWKFYITQILLLSKKLGNEGIAELTKEQIADYLKKISHINYRLWYVSLIHELFDPEGERILKEEIKKYGFENLDDDTIKDMIMPNEISYQNLAERDLMAIALKSKQNKNIERDMNEYVKKYHFIRNTWGHVFLLTKNNFMPKLRKYEKLPASELRNKIQEINSYKERVKKRRKELINKYRFPKELLNILYFYHMLVDWRDERKAWSQRINYWQFLILKRLSILINIKTDLLLFSYPEELVKLIPNGFPSDFEYILKQRSKKCVRFRENKVTRVVIGKEADYVINLIDNYYFKSSQKNITGQIGNKGVIKSKVKIIINHRDFKKLKKGEIIVSAMTRPDYTPILSKAGGIITDEGGITCHAAIVARELNIPCIIGTQVVTKCLKDNDLVELNANKGTIKIIKKK